MPSEDEIIEFTGDVTNLPSTFEEGNYNPQYDIKEDSHSDISSQDSYTENQGYTGPLDDMENQTMNEIADNDIVSDDTPHKIISGRIRKHTPRFEDGPSTYKPTMRQQEHQHKKHKKSLMKAFEVEVIH